MIGQRPDATVAKPGGCLLDLLSTEAIDDAAFFTTPFQEGRKMALRLGLLDDRVSDVWPVEARGEDRRVFEHEPSTQIIPGLRVSSCGEGYSGHTGETVSQHGKLSVLRAEIMAPLADAVRFV